MVGVCRQSTHGAEGKARQFPTEIQHLYWGKITNIKCNLI